MQCRPHCVNQLPLQIFICNLSSHSKPSQVERQFSISKTDYIFDLETLKNTLNVSSYTERHVSYLRIVIHYQTCDYERNSATYGNRVPIEVSYAKNELYLQTLSMNL